MSKIFVRARILNDCFKRARFSKKEILEILNDKIMDEFGWDSVSARTLDEDIERFRNFFETEVIYDKKRNIYRYEDSEVDLFNKPIKQAQIDSLQQALDIIKQLKIEDLHTEIEDVISTLEATLKSDGVINQPFMLFDFKPEVNGSHFLRDLIDCIKQKTVVRFQYLPFYAKEPEEVILHPYLLKEYNSRWYIVGFCERKKRIFNYPLDRVTDKGFKGAGSNYVYRDPVDFYPDKYYTNIIGVTLPEGKQPQQIILQFKKPRAFYVHTAKWHKSQKVTKETKDYMIFQWELIINPELISTILQYGKDVKIIEPESLKIEIVKILKEAVGQY